MARYACLFLLVSLAASSGSTSVLAQTAPPKTEADYYPIQTLPIPEDVVLEVGGLALLPSGDLGVSTRRGEVWVVENPYAEGRRPHYRRFAQGLHEPLGLAWRDGALFAAQRGELTRLEDTDGDGRADRYDAVVTWPLSGNYHEYSYGPIFRDDGTMLASLNLAWVGYGASLADWRGWALEITPDGRQTPFATGMRSPAGIGLVDGELFYAENQGDWVGSGSITHVERGDFVGNPAGLRWTEREESPLTLRAADIPDTGEPMHEVARRVPGLKPPAVWFPHTLMGISTSDILPDSTGGAFGPFAGQVFVGDQGHSKIMRVSLEEVDGVYQGAVFPFREGFASGVLRLAWGRDGSLFVGQTSRGWRATGPAPYALERVVWSGEIPFEPLTIQARPDGFELTFTRPVDAAAAADPSSYGITGFTYRYHHNYGSPIIDDVVHPVRAAVVSDDGTRVRLVVEGLREGYIHEVKMGGVRSRGGAPLLHDVGYYTLNVIPGGERLEATGPVPRAASTPVAPSARRSPQPRRQPSMPASWADGPEVTVVVGTQPGLRYDLESFRVRPGARVRLVFNNDDDMLHNLLITRPGTADEVATLAINLGLRGPELGYIPDTPAVLFHTALLEPETTDTIYFEAPTEPGDYPFVCTFPGHALTMRGVMEVR